MFCVVFRTWKYIEKEVPKVPLHIPIIIVVRERVHYSMIVSYTCML